MHSNILDRLIEVDSQPETIYLAGPMTGLPNFNEAEFAKYAEKYRAQGFKVISPPELDAGDYHNPGGYRYYLSRDIKAIFDNNVSRIYLLPGWQNSKGARLEHHIATLCEIPLFDAESGEPYSETILQEAQRLVHGDRGEQYGHPIFDLTRMADIGTANIRHKLRPGVRLEAEDAARMMIGTKLSRETFMPKRDNRVDTAGYAEVLDMIVQWREQNPGQDPRDHY